MTPSNKYIFFIYLALLTVNCSGIRTTDKLFTEHASCFSPIDIIAAKDNAALYIAGYAARQIAVFDREEKKVVTSISLPEKPTGLELSHHGTQLYITCGSPEGSVVFYNTCLDSIIAEIRVGHTPVSPVLSPDGRELYVCNRFDNDISVIDIVAQSEVSRIPKKVEDIVPLEYIDFPSERVSGDQTGNSYQTASSSGSSIAAADMTPLPEMREPISAAISPDGKFLYVANHLPPGGGVAAGITVIDTESRKITGYIPLPNGSTSLRGLCISPDGKYVYVTHILARYNLPATQLDRGWINTNALSIIDAVDMYPVETVLLDDVGLGAANPWGVVCSLDGATLYATHAGTHELSVIDRVQLHKKLAVVLADTSQATISSAKRVSDDLSFLVGLRKRIQLQGYGPRSIALAGETVYVAEYFSDTITIMEHNSITDLTSVSKKVAPDIPMTLQRKGERLFNDASMCFQQWQSCSSCHPDGRADGLNWDLLNDGVGNPKNTKSLLLTHRTPPVMVTGIRADFETAVRAGIRHSQFTVQPEEYAAALEAYMEFMKPVPSPQLSGNKLSRSAHRGKKVFIKAGCAECHPSPLYTDLKAYDVGTGIGRESEVKFDTPSLVEAWRTAPFLYNGRAGTMLEVLKSHNAGDFHGVTSGLSGEDIDNLIAFVMSL